MRWNCPHCGVALAVSDDKLGTGWSFSRCYKCGGHALVRRTDINLIKVDKAPQGEQILLPEAHEEPKLGQQALEHMNKITEKSAVNSANTTNTNDTAKPVIKPAIQKAAPIPPMNIPEPLPELPNNNTFKHRILPSAIAVAGLFTIGSGFYLYNQGQQLWTKAREAAVDNQPAQIAEPTIQNTNTIAMHEPVTDKVNSNAMAPTRTEIVANQSANAGMMIRAKVKGALREGPGLNYKVIASAVPNMSYAVMEWKDRWFHVILPTEQNDTNAPKTAWIRNDLVDIAANNL